MVFLLWACNGADKVEGAASTDADHDGFLSTVDCDDHNAAIYPGAAEQFGNEIDEDCNGSDPLQSGVFQIGDPDDGFGSALGLGPEGLWVGAPYAEGGRGRVYALANDGSETHLRGNKDAHFGSRLLWQGARLLIGAPGEGGVYDGDGNRLLEAEGAGMALAALGDVVVSSTRQGSLGSDGSSHLWEQQPDALCFDGTGTLIAGFSHGLRGVVREQITHPHTSADGLGSALLWGDGDGDGVEELIVGAPEAGAVVFLDENLQEKSRITLGRGRFGAALALAAPGLLYIGAPTDGLNAEGGVYVGVQGQAPRLVLSGEAADDQLGVSLLAGPHYFVAGAPGSSQRSGSVFIQTGLSQ